MDIKDLLKEASNLPNVPDVARELIVSLNDENADYDEITAKVRRDQTLSLKVLRLVNSAHFGLSREVGSIDEAVVMLGMEKLKLLVIASGFSGSVKEADGLNLKKFWEESFLVAALAGWFADKTDAAEADKAFTAGLIHNIGRLLLHLAQPMRAKAIQTLIEEQQVSRSEAEMERLGFTTPEAGEALMQMWKFPPELCDAVRQHKAPLSFDETSPTACVVNLACFINACRRREEPLENVLESFPKDVAEAIGISSSILAELEQAMTLESGLDSLNEA